MLGQFMHGWGYTAVGKVGKSPHLNSHQAESRCPDSLP